MTNYDLTFISEESEELTGMLAVMTQAMGDDGDNEMYRTVRAMFKKAKALETHIHERSTSEMIKKDRNEKAA